MGEVNETQSDVFEELTLKLSKNAPWLDDWLRPGRKLFDNTRELGRRRGGCRFKGSPDFNYPGPVGGRPVSDSGATCPHFDIGTVIRCQQRINGKLVDGSEVSASHGSKVHSGNAARDHERYVTDKIAQDCSEKLYAGYLEMTGIVEHRPLPQPAEAVFSNIHDDPGIRELFWDRVHKNERARRPDWLSFDLKRLTVDHISTLAESPGLATEALAVLDQIAARCDGSKAKTPIELDRRHARLLLAAAKSLPGWDPANPMLKAHQGRGGRTQYRFVCELPFGLNRGGRERVLAEYCEMLDRRGVMYTAVIHVPDAHNDVRNYHAHIIVYDRPCRFDPERGEWDFERPKEVDANGFRIGGRADKSDLFKTSGDGTFFKQGADIYRDLRQHWVDICNLEAARAGLSTRYDARTFDAMGIDQQPSVHLGNDLAALESAGEVTPDGLANDFFGWQGEANRSKAKQEQRTAARLIRVSDALAAAKAAGVGSTTATDALLTEYKQSAAKLAALEKSQDRFYRAWDLRRSRAVKTRDTCISLLAGVGQQGRKPVREEPLIKARLVAAEAHIAMISGEIEPLATRAVALAREIEGRREALSTMEANLLAKLAVPIATGLQIARPAPLRSQPISHVPAGNALNSRTALNTQFGLVLDRITKDKLFVFLVKRTGGPVFEAQGLSPVEQNLLEMPRFKNQAQSSLASRHQNQKAELGRLQKHVRRHQQAFLPLSASAQTTHNVPDAVRTLHDKYRDHPQFQQFVQHLMSVQTVDGHSAPEALSGRQPPQSHQAGKNPVQAATTSVETSTVRSLVPDRQQQQTSVHPSSPAPVDRLLKHAVGGSSFASPQVRDHAEDNAPLLENSRTGMVSFDHAQPEGRRAHAVPPDLTGQDPVRNHSGVADVGGSQLHDTTKETANVERTDYQRRLYAAAASVVDELHESDPAGYAGGGAANAFAGMRNLSDFDVEDFAGRRTTVQVSRRRRVGLGPHTYGDQEVRRSGDSPGTIGSENGFLEGRTPQAEQGAVSSAGEGSPIAHCEKEGGPSAEADVGLQKSDLGANNTFPNQAHLGGNGPSNGIRLDATGSSYGQDRLSRVDTTISDEKTHPEPLTSTGTMESNLGGPADSIRVEQRKVTGAANGRPLDQDRAQNQNRLAVRQNPDASVVHISPAIEAAILDVFVKSGSKCVRRFDGEMKLNWDAFSEDLHPYLANALNSVGVKAAIYEVISVFEREEEELQQTYGLDDKGRGR